MFKRLPIGENTFKGESTNIQISRVFPLMIFIIIGFTGTHPFGYQRSSALLSEIPSDPYRQMIYGLLYTWSGIIIFKNRKDFSKIVSDWIVPLSFIVFALISVIWSYFPIKVLKDTMHILGMLLIATLAVKEFEKDMNLFIKVVFISTSFVIVASIVSVVLYPQGAISRFPYNRWSGVTMHANSLGRAAMFCIVASLSYMFMQTKRSTKLVALIVMFLSWICLINSDSKTSLTITLCVVLTMILFRIVDSLEAFTPVMIKFITVFFLGSAIFHFAYLFWPEFFELKNFFRLMGRSPDLTGRTQLWQMSWNAIILKPILGWGFDGLYSAKRTVLSGIRYYQMHNGYLDILLRSGTVGGILTLIILMKTAGRLWKALFVDKEVWLFFTAVFFITIIYNITQASIYVPCSNLWGIYLCLYLVLGRVTRNMSSKVLVR